MAEGEVKRSLTVKEQKLVKGIAAGKTKLKAAKDAGYSGDGQTLRSNTYKVLSRPNVQEALHATLVKHGITLDAAIAPIKRALDHNEIELQLKGSDRALKLMGISNNNEGGTTNYNFINVANEQKEKYGI